MKKYHNFKTLHIFNGEAKTNLIYNLYLDRRPYPDTPSQIQFTPNSYSWSKERMA